MVNLWWFGTSAPRRLLKAGFQNSPPTDTATVSAAGNRRREKPKGTALDAKLVKDIMVPLENYAVVDSNATIFDALLALKESQKHLKPGQCLHRAVLVKDDEGAIVGKLGHLAFLKSLEPKYDTLGDLPILARAGLTTDFISSLADKWGLMKDDLGASCQRLKTTKVAEAMHAVNEQIDQEAPLTEAIHDIVMWQTLSILVTHEGKATGLLRLSDLFHEVFAELSEDCT